ncbi:MAG TPA: prolyl oligopeptidase family serine peptidase [Pirellulales bacterium]|jgi:pimeloyl-ACP methyl ester carboxylesterase|nr:prolyl oligopeptidase family serine peptidase [Pirellulales bacterium]
MRLAVQACGFVCFAVSLGLVARADGPKDNLPGEVRPIPPVGVEVSEADRAELEQGLHKLQEKIEQLRKRGQKEAKIAALVPDVEVFARAVHGALTYREFFVAGDVAKGKSLWRDGLARADALLSGDAPWTRQTGLVVRGYVSKLDNTVQPYGLVIPESYQFDGAARHRLDLWFHGRGETLSEVNFLDQRQKQLGQIAPADTIVLHPYGRYSNAFKLAGEVDVLEALDSVRGRYRVDDDRVVVRGFSMGGAGVWHMAVHRPDLWVAATPGAGFSETPAFLKIFQQEEVAPAPWERTLWHMYDCTDWARNLVNLPTIAYSGELDRQKQAADVMALALAKQGLTLTHIIGPQTQHKLHPDSLAEIERRLASIVAKGRQRVPHEIDFTTYTLRYNRMAWIAIEALDEHWKPARVRGQIGDGAAVDLHIENIAALRLAFPSGWSPFLPERSVSIMIDDHLVSVPGPETDRSWSVRLNRVKSKWQVVAGDTPNGGKRPGLQGPIDDAFLDAFVFVRPTSKGRHDAIDRWTQAELQHAIDQWRRQMRGVARVVDDVALDEATIASCNLVLWGDPKSNQVLAKLADRLPIGWTEREVIVGNDRYAAEQHVPVLIYPNPLNPQRYVVLNSSFTYREYDYLNNARQVPKLPDWAVIDVRTPADSRWPGNIVAADFFDEQWKLKPRAK